MKILFNFTFRMKKFFLAILTMMYMTVTSGIAMEIHYCMGKKAGMDFYGNATDKCGSCGMTENKSGCCHDEHQFYKLSDWHKNITNDINFSAIEIAVANEYPFYSWQLPAFAANAVSNNHSPPECTRPSACVLNCTFRL